MPADYTLDHALTLQMVAIMALDELRIAATHRRTGPGRVFLGLVKTEAYWTTPPHFAVIRRASAYFRLGTMAALFTRQLNYPLLDTFETHLSGALWMLAQDLQIVDGSSFVLMTEDRIAPPVCAVQNNEVALLMNIDHDRGVFRVTAAIVN